MISHKPFDSYIHSIDDFDASSNLKFRKIPDVSFVPPVEFPRKSHHTTNHGLTFSGLHLPNIHVEDSSTDRSTNSFSSPKWSKNLVIEEPVLASDSPVPKLVLCASSHKRFFSVNSDESTKRKRTPSSSKKSKRKRHYDLEDSKHYKSQRLDSTRSTPIHSLCSSSSSASPSSCFSLISCCSSPSTFSPTEEVPRLAPLRIQLPRSLNSRHMSAPGSLNTHQSIDPGHRSKRQTSLKSSIELSSANQCHDGQKGLKKVDKNKEYLMPAIAITDVTSRGITISIKECESPNNFFGIPSCQRVCINCSKSLKPNQQANIVTTSKTQTPVTVSSSIIPKKLLCSFEEGQEENLSPDRSQPIKNDVDKAVTSTGLIHTNLSTIYEESTMIDSHISSSDVTNFESCTNSNEVSMNEMKKENCLDEVGKYLITDSNETSSSSTTALILAATEAAMKTSLEPPSSPGLLLAPTRSSTPVEKDKSHLIVSKFENNDRSDEISADRSVSSKTSSSCTNPVPTSSFSSPIRKNSRPLSTTACHTYRPMATIFGQVRSIRGSFNGRSHSSSPISHVFTTDMSRKSKSKPSTYKEMEFLNSTKSVNSNLSKKYPDGHPLNVYTFPGDSSSNRSISLTGKSKLVSRSNQIINKPSAPYNLPCMSMNSCPQMPDLHPSSTAPFTMNDNFNHTSFDLVNNTNALATAICLQQLQMQFMYNSTTSSDTTFAALTAAAALSELSPNENLIQRQFNSEWPSGNYPIDLIPNFYPNLNTTNRNIFPSDINCLLNNLSPMVPYNPGQITALPNDQRLSLNDANFHVFSMSSSSAINQQFNTDLQNNDIPIDLSAKR